MTRLIFLFGALALASAPAASATRPNIIFIMADDLGYSDLGCFGGEIQTPNLDRMAREGIRFTQFYNEAKCVESRTALLTGFNHNWSNNLKRRQYKSLPERLGAEGYRTLMVGKWHLPDTPLERGFDRYFGFLNGAVNFWTGAPTGRDKTPQFLLDDESYSIPESGFYTTDVFTDYAIEFIDEAVHRDEQEPFFLYLAHNAPHYPLHAWPEDIDKYRGRYDVGWDALREERFERMKRMGLLEEGSKLSVRDPNVPAWEDLTDEVQEEYSLLMTVYAAMVDRLDQNVGRLLVALKERGVDENTLVIFCSDNGGCPYQNEEKPDSVPGGPESDRTYNTPWANASNTPFRLYKRFSHEGGTASPFIARWPGQIENPGRAIGQVGHLIDMTPTFLELADASFDENPSAMSLVSAIQGEATPREQPLFWEYARHHAVRDGDLKLVAESGGDWRLYDLAKDRIESEDLASARPADVERLAALYDDWAERSTAPDHAACRESRPMRMKDYTAALAQKPSP